jgi:hypothetical protein
VVINDDERVVSLKSRILEVRVVIENTNMLNGFSSICPSKSVFSVNPEYDKEELRLERRGGSDKI